MATREELLAEAYRRGILPPQMKTAYEEAMRRGLVQPKETNIPTETATAHPPAMMPAHQPEKGFVDSIIEKIPRSDTPGNALTDVAPYYRMMLEGGGIAAGTAIGAPAGPLGMAAGGGLGYSGGKWAADQLDAAAKLTKAQTIFDQYLDPVGANFMDRGSTAEVVTRPIRDTITGVAFAGPAEAAVIGVSKGVDLTKRGWQAVVSKFKAPALSGKEAERRAANYLIENTSVGPIYAKNTEEAQKIEDLINAGIKEGDPVFRFSLAQQSGGPNLIKTERSIVLPKGQAADQLKLREAENSDALARFWERNFKGKENIDEVLDSLLKRQEAGQKRVSQAERTAQYEVERLPAQPPEETGVAALDELSSAVRPVKQVMNELEQSIPNYPIKLDNLRTQLHLLKKDPKINIDQRRALQSFEENDLPALISEGENTFSAMGINRTLGDRAAKLKKAGEKDIAYIFERLRKDGLQADIDAISELARTGKIIQSGGKMINADELAERLETGLKTLAEMRQAQTPDLDAMATAIAEKVGRRPLQVVRESDKQYLERLTKDYKRLVGGEVPIKSSHTPEAIKELEKRITDIRGVLSEASPGQDVGAAMRAYNEFASKEYFGRFDKGAVKDVLRRGDEAAGTRLKIEDIPKQFKGASGAEDLIRAVGQEKATELMRGNMAYDLLNYATDKNTGQIVTSRLNTWLARNKITLEKYGLQGDFKGLEAAQKSVDAARDAAAVYEKSVAGRLIGSDPGKVIGTIINGNKTAEATKQLLEQISNDKTAVNGLKNAFGEYIRTQAETSWPKTSGGYTTSQAQFTRLMNKANEAAKVLYRDEPEKMAALKTVQRAYEISARTSRSPVSSNSDTAEKSVGILSDMAGKIASATGGMKAQAAKAFWRYLKNAGDDRVQQILVKAIFDPEYAYMIERGAKGFIDPKQLEAMVGNKIIRLEDYKRQAMRQTAIGTEAAASGNE